jgi:thiol:disulfide interchange protein DsbD
LETFRQLLAFPLFATVVWLLWVFGQQAGNNALALVMLALTGLAFGAWLWGRAQQRSGRAAALSVMALSVIAAAFVGREGTTAASATMTAAPITTSDPIAGRGAVAWQDYSPAALEAARASGRPVLLDFTAAWCLSCQVNERVALSTESVQRAVAAGNVIMMRADWTSRDADR